MKNSIFKKIPDALFVAGMLGLAFRIVDSIGQSKKSREEKAELQERIRMARENGHPTTA